MNYNIIILGPKHVDKMAIAKHLTSINDDLNICPTFITDLEYKNKVTDDFLFYITNDEVELGYKNNAFLYVTSYETYNKGIEIQHTYNSDIFVLDFIDCNNISERAFDELTNKIFVWVDKSEKSNDQEDIFESEYAFERSNKYDLLYFVNEDPEDISKVILEYIDDNTTEERRRELLEENS